MRLLCLAFFAQCLFTASSSQDCQLTEKWKPSKNSVNLNLAEIYLPLNQTGLEISVEVSVQLLGRAPSVAIVRYIRDYQTNETCENHELVRWHAGNMSLISATINGCPLPLDWSNIQMYFSDDLVLGILTECSPPNRIRHVLYNREFGGKRLPTKKQVQDLVTRYEKSAIHLDETNQGYKPFELLGLSWCLCPNEVATIHPALLPDEKQEPQPETPQPINTVGQYFYILLAGLIVVLILAMVYASNCKK